MEEIKFNSVRAAEKHVRDEQNSAEIQKVGIEDDEFRSKKLKKQSSNCKVNGNRYFCKQCDKGFKSPKAVFGHMRCHSNSNSNNNNNNNNSNINSNHNCNSNGKAKKKAKAEVPRKKRSVGRYKINPASSNTSWSYMNSSSVNGDDDDDDDELKDIAVSLLMLANGRRVSHSYSDDDSVKVGSDCQQCDFDYMDFTDDHGDLEPNVKQCGLYHHKQPAVNDKVTENITVSVQSGSNFVVCFDSIKDRSEDSPTDVKIPFEHCNAEMRDEEVQVEIVHTTGLLNPHSCSPAAENPKSEVNIQIGRTTEHQAELFDSEIKTPDTVIDSLSTKSCHLPVEQRKVADQDSHKCDSGAETDNVCFMEYICRVCNRRFLSQQALGGHRLHCPPKKKNCRARAIATNISNTMVPQDGSNKKRWTHNCQMCCKAFSSGQALGGHMRAHFNANV